MKLSYQDLGQGITCIETCYQRPNLASCYLLQEGDEAALIDTGTAYTMPLIMELLGKRGLAPEQVKYVVPTHVHLDHAGGAGQLMEALPAATLVVHPYGARHLIDPAKLTAGAMAIYGEAQFKQDYDVLKPVPASRLVEAADGFAFELAGRKLICLDTPGHARHHFCIWDERTRGFFTGDSFGIAYPELETEQGPFMFLPSTPVQFDPEAWHGTLDRLMEYKPQRMYLTHYCGVENPAALVDKLHEELDDYAEIALASDARKLVQSIKARLRRYYLERLREHGCRLDEAGIDEVLDMDIGLCAQGLEVWLQRQETQPG